MRLYEVSYKANDWTDKINVVRVAAANVIKAALFVGKRKYTGYGGYVTRVDEIFTDVQVAN